MTLQQRRMTLDMSLGECARACGLGSSVMSQIERGMTIPPQAVLEDLARVLNCTVEDVRAGLPSPEEAASLQKRATEAMEAFAAVLADAKAHGLKKGNGGFGEIRCPICGGQIRYSVAGCNGHVWGACSTPGCVRWMS